MAGKKILVIGGGGREYALAWKLHQSPQCSEILCVPGNGGMASFGEQAAMDAEDAPALASFARARQVDLAIVGPEAALAAGVSDRLRQAGIVCFGPSKAAARIESSKIFARQLAAKAGIPGPAFFRCRNLEQAERALAADPSALVVKADGLAAGKGVIVAADEKEALAAAASWLRRGAILMEEKMEGREASFFALAAGREAMAFGSAQDYKRAFEGDKGPNTGGMGAVSPSPRMDGAMEEEIMRRIIRPALAALADAGTPFYGLLYAGLMMDASGPRLVEFNARFGDPECQLLMLRLKSDLLPALLAVAEGHLPPEPVWRQACAAGVVLAAKGYPGAYESGHAIKGLDGALPEGAVCFHAATKKVKNGYIASGGRVLMAAALGYDYRTALARAYRAAAQLGWPQSFYRRDIGHDVL